MGNDGFGNEGQSDYQGPPPPKGQKSIWSSLSVFALSFKFLGGGNGGRWTAVGMSERDVTVVKHRRCGHRGCLQHARR